MTSNHRRPIIGLLLLIAVVAIGVWWINRGYGETSELGYAYATALFSACNQKDDARLDKIEEMVQASAASGALGESEAKWLNRIIQDGRNGNWQAASKAIRQLMEDQRKRAPRLPT